MLDKSLAWCGNTLLATILVLLCGADAVFAQETPKDDPKADLMLQVPDRAADPGETEVQPSGRITIPMTGQAQARRFGNLSTTPNRFDTGLIEIGDSKSITLQLEHTGPASSDEVSIGGVRIEGKSAGEYTVDFAGGVTLYPGDVQPITITFNPRTPGPKSASLMLDIDGFTAPYSVFLGGLSRYALVSELEVSTLDLGFGQIIQNEPVAKTLTLSNSGDVGAPTIFVSSAQLGGENPDAFQVDFAPVSIAPGESMDVTVTLQSPAEGTKNAVVQFVHDGNNASFDVAVQGQVVTPNSVPITFDKSTLAIDVNPNDPTAMQFGPDGKLYVGERYGLIRVYDVVRNGKNNYQASQVETIDLIEKVQNHNDDGSPSGNFGRQLTGFHVVGDAANPIVYAASSDPRFGAGPNGTDTGLDTNSGILHKLTKAGGGWQKQDLVRGLPRSEENHTPNGIVVQGNTAYLLSGGNTNLGIASLYFARLSEYALSGALLKIDLGAIGNATYDLPTLDDEDRDGPDDANDPFGGNNGKNQAKLVAGGPVQIHTAGLRNAYDIVLTESGKFYTFDNGSNVKYGPRADGSCGNPIVENGGEDHQDQLHLLVDGGYVGHPNPVRGNKANTFNGSNPQSPVEVAADERECNFLDKDQDGSLTTMGASTNGIDEYSASNFAGTMKGDLLAVTLNGELFRLELNSAGNDVTSKSVLSGGNGSTLALEVVGDDGPFPGTIWMAQFLNPQQIFVLEPSDY